MAFLSNAIRESRTLLALLRIKRGIDRLRLDGDLTVADAIEAAVDRAPLATAVRFEDRRWTYADLDAAANRVAHWARAQGAVRGDVVALLMENRPEYLAVWIGLAKLGAVTALINTNLSAGALAHALTVAKPRLVVVGAEMAAAYETAREGRPERAATWVMRDATTLAGGAAYRDLDEALTTAESTRPPREWRAEMTTGDDLFYIYTSGTTGLPKAARFSHYRFLGVASAYTIVAGISDADVVYCCLPLYHTAGGVLAVSMAILNGGTLALRRRFSASAFWDDCRTFDVSVFQYIGELCRYLLNRPESPDDRRHRVRCAVGNGLRPDIWERFQSRFGIRDIREFYGATEGNFALLNLDNKIGAVGRVPPYLKRAIPVDLVRFDVESDSHLRAADGSCVRCKAGEVGEAIGRIPSDRNEPLGRFEGYTDDDASRRKVLRDVFRKGDAWFRTGDLLVRDDEGYYYFVDRIGDTFRWKGENVATSEVAEVIGVFDGVIEANVYGVKVPGADGRAGMAALVCDGSFDRQRFYAHVGQRLPAYARPMFLRMKREMDTTGTFKHRKIDLVREGYDPSIVSEPLFFRDDRAAAYVPLDSLLYARIENGDLAL